jgi:uncharacterized membrane protein
MMIMRQYYNSINTRGMETEQEQETKSTVWCGACYSNTYVYVVTPVAWLAVCIAILLVIIVLLYVLSIFIGLIVVILNTVFEQTMVYIVGRDTYNKNFPICTNTEYIGKNCYNTTNTYCS